MALPLLHRRQLLRLGGLAGLALLGGCDSGARSQLVYAPGELPSAWLKTLPKPWQGSRQPSPAAVLAALGKPGMGLLQLSDGWALDARTDQLAPLGAPNLLAQLAPFAASPSRLFQDEGAPGLAFPWAFSTWVLVLRNRADLGRRRQEGWSLLLDPSLKGRLVLPSSPRVAMELVLRQLGLPSEGSWSTAGALAKADPAVLANPAGLDDPRLPAAIRRLRSQALACDEANGLNLLLAGEAAAAVLPARRVLALLPESGSPLIWSLLLRPAGAAPLPQEWLAEILKPPLLNRLLAKGWVPPLPAQRLAAPLAAWPEPVAQLMLPAPEVLARCNSLAPFGEAERIQWQALWDQAAPKGPTQAGS